jgi:2'-hydroxyisoflavone reductase
VLGGTGFAGPPIVAAARARGHTVTLFNRGRTDPGLFPDVETILGDRVTELDKLRGRDWDAVVDTWAPGPRLVREATALLADHVGQYVFLSTISVYKLGRDPIDESSTLLSLPPGTQLKGIKVDDKTYGPLKVMAEQAAEAGMPGRATSVRAGVLAGPRDPTDRFLYWPERIARGGEMIAPGAATDPMQFLDTRDLGEFIVGAIERRAFGIFNAVGPAQPTIGAVLGDVRAALASDVALTWVPTAWLKQQNEDGWGNFPLAVPPENDDSGFARVSAAKAVAAGLRFRAPGETAKDALAWWRAQPDDLRARKRPGIDADKEKALLARFHASTAAAASR